MMNSLRLSASLGLIVLLAGACSDDTYGGDDDAGVNENPVAQNDTAATDENTPISIAVLANDSDPDQADAMIPTLGVAQIDDTDLQGAVSLDVGGRAIIYDPTAALDGLDDGAEVTETFSYVVGDGEGGTATATVTVTVTGLNDGPRIAEQTLVTEGSVVVALVADDPEDPAVTFAIGEGPTNGSLGPIVQIDELNAEVTYVPKPGFAGADSFTVIGNDGRVNGEPTTISIQVGLEPLILEPGSYLVDTDAGTIDGVRFPGFNGTTFTASVIDIQAGAFVLATGANPLDFHSATDVNMGGFILANGQAGGDGGIGCDDLGGGAGGAGGPGGFAGGGGGGSAPGTDNQNGGRGLGPGGGFGGAVNGDINGSAGGGGGGHETRGEAGGTFSVTNGRAGDGGFSYTFPLIGGSGGGGGTVEKDSTVQVLNFADDDGSGGGGGGGAVRFIANGSMLVSGMIDVSGGDGGSNDCLGGDGGGGSGGLIQLFSTPLPDLGPDHLFDVSGGNGGGGTGGAGATGRVEIGFTPSE